MTKIWSIFGPPLPIVEWSWERTKKWCKFHWDNHMYRLYLYRIYDHPGRPEWINEVYKIRKGHKRDKKKQHWQKIVFYHRWTYWYIDHRWLKWWHGFLDFHKPWSDLFIKRETKRRELRFRRAVVRLVLKYCFTRYNYQTQFINYLKTFLAILAICILIVGINILLMNIYQYYFYTSEIKKMKRCRYYLDKADLKKKTKTLSMDPLGEYEKEIEDIKPNFFQKYYYGRLKREKKHVFFVKKNKAMSYIFLKLRKNEKINKIFNLKEEINCFRLAASIVLLITVIFATLFFYKLVDIKTPSIKLYEKIVDFVNYVCWLETRGYRTKNYNGRIWNWGIFGVFLLDNVVLVATVFLLLEKWKETRQKEYEYKDEKEKTKKRLLVLHKKILKITAGSKTTGNRNQ